MINVTFSSLDKDGIHPIIERFNSDYPNSPHAYDTNEEELIFKNVTDHLENVDTFLCEEICHEFEVCCYIQNVEDKTSKNYYFDEEDEWIYK